MMDKLMEDSPELGHYLAQDENIVHSPLFESAVTKIQTERIGELSEAKREVVTEFEVAKEAPVRRVDQLDDSDYYKELQECKRLKLLRVTVYQDLRYVGYIGFSGDALYSAKCVTTDRPNRLGTILFNI
ncbi:unnamed protein product [Phytophthora fragariaefolia]|uniref:Unnamed protein product n=1 Tax=Phytophthora fragariaefolia TaxID=1490495 RepID=A0A9W7CPF2_9STRA|nr:unnamed protein product [Phytophthora fragariaefolia]